SGQVFLRSAGGGGVDEADGAQVSASLDVNSNGIIDPAEKISVLADSQGKYTIAAPAEIGRTTVVAFEEDGYAKIESLVVGGPAQTDGRLKVGDRITAVAQGQAEYMASIGSWSHTGPGGISYTQRLLNAGYPLSGGFRAENVLTINSDISGYNVVHSSSWADAEHQNTMLSVELTEIGAGVAVRDGMGYYVLDCARSTSSGVVQPSGGNAPVSGTPVTKGPSQILSAVVLSTPRDDGAIYHDVQYGQSLWSIAIAYGTKIDEIKRLNNLTSNNIYLGQKLLIKNAGTATPTIPVAAQTETPQQISTGTSTLMSNTATTAVTPTLTAEPQTSAKNGGVLTGIIIIIALLAAGIGTWLGTKKPV
ncbi:MAG: LysM peptidoglycan-binding domain-containing protein, partial [Anaerolineales bacterium]|nr:LysM peptidoglycan-binding domain-containing protein [Anaerolineales bacterium]